MGRYEVEIMRRYGRAFEVAMPASLAYVDGGVNGGLFAAGIGANEAMWRAKAGVRNDGMEAVEVFDAGGDGFCFADMTLSSGDMRLDFGFRGAGLMDNGVFAPPAMVSFKRNKTVTVTQVDRGDENEIVECFGINSWEIEMRGIVVDMEGHGYPSELVRRLVGLFNVNEVIEVSSAVFADMGVRSIWLKDQVIEPVEGFVDTVRYTLTARSIRDVAFDLIVQ